jgi:hypothetical protein
MTISTGASAQQLTPFVISTSGGFYSNASGSLSFTVGEMAAVETFTAPASILTQGFQQPWDFGTYVIDYPGAEFSFDVFPNPSGSVVHLYTQSVEQAALKISVTDILGREVFHSELFHSDVLQLHQLDLSIVTSGTYFLTLAINWNGAFFKGNRAITIQIIR